MKEANRQFGLKTPAVLGITSENLEKKTGWTFDGTRFLAVTVTISFPRLQPVFSFFVASLRKLIRAKCYFENVKSFFVIFNNTAFTAL